MVKEVVKKSETDNFLEGQAARISQLISNMNAAKPQRKEELTRAKKQLAQEFILLCKQNKKEPEQYLTKYHLTVVKE